MTDHTARGLEGLCLAIQLVAKALDVVGTIGDDDIVARQYAFDGRIFFGAGILLSLCSVVDASRNAKRLVVDEVNPEFTGA